MRDRRLTLRTLMAAVIAWGVLLAGARSGLLLGLVGGCAAAFPVLAWCF